MGQQRSCIDVDCVAAGRLDDGDVAAADLLCEVLDRAHSIVQVLLVDDLFQTGRDSLKVVAGEATVRRETLGEDEQVVRLLCPLAVVQRQEAADVGQPVLLGRHGAAISNREHLLRDGLGRVVRVALLAQLDKPGVLSEPTGVEEHGDAILIADRSDGPQVHHRHWLATAGVVRDRDHHQRDPLHAPSLDGAPQRIHVHIALERQDRGRIPTLRGNHVQRLRALVLDVRPGRIEVCVVGDGVAVADRDREEDLLCRPSLVGGDDVPIAGEVTDDFLEAVERTAASVRLVAKHHPGPLLRRHGAGSGVGQQIDDNLVRV